MLLPGNADLAAALEGNNRVYAVNLLADWAGDGNYGHTHSDLSEAVESLGYDRTAGNDLPEETTLIQGYQVGSLRVQLVGTVAGTEVTELFSTYRSTSPLVGEDLVGTLMKFTVTVETAGGSVEVPQFLGVLRSVSVSSSERVVDLEVLDYAATLASRVDLPSASIFAREKGQYPLTTTQWLVDHALRKSGVYATPAFRDDAIFAATGHGGLAAEVGFNGLISTWYANSVAEWTDSVWPGILATGASWATTRTGLGALGMCAWCAATSNVDMAVSGNGFAAGMWIYAGASMTNVSPAGARDIFRFIVGSNDDPSAPEDAMLILVMDSAGVIEAQLYTYSGGFVSIHQTAFTGSERWQFLGVHFGREGSNLRATIHLDGVNSSSVVTAPFFSTLNKCMGVKVGLSRPWSDIQVWPVGTAPTGTWPLESTSHTPEATIPEGRARFSYLPENSQASGLSLLKDAVGAEYGHFGFDEAGNFFYEEADYSPADTANPDRVITNEFPLTDLGSDRLLDSVRNKITSTVREQYWSSLSGGILFEAEESSSFVVAANSTAVVQISLTRLPQGSYMFPAQRLPRTTTVDYEAGARGFVAVNNGGTTEQTSVWVKFEQTGIRTGQVTIRNGTSGAIRLETSQGDPALRVFGYESTRLKDVVFDAIDTPSVDKYTEREFGIAPSQWRSDPGPYRNIAGELLTQLRKPVTTLKEVHMIGDPRDQIGDLHEIQDPDGLGEPIYGKVQGIARSYSRSSGLEQTIQYRVQRDETQNTYRGFEGLDAGLVDFFDSWVLAVEFRVTSTSWLSQMGFWRETADVNPTEMRLYRVDSALSGTPVDGTYIAVDPSGPTGAWRWYPLPEPVLLDADQPYYACFLFPNSKWPGVSNYWSTGPGANGIVNGPLFLPGRSGAVRAVNGNGNFVAGAGGMTFPTNFTNAGENRGIDVTVTDNPFGP